MGKYTSAVLGALLVSLLVYLLLARRLDLFPVAELAEFLYFFAFAAVVILAVYLMNRLVVYIRVKRTGESPDYTLPEDREETNPAPSRRPKKR